MLPSLVEAGLAPLLRRLRREEVGHASTGCPDRKPRLKFLCAILSPRSSKWRAVRSASFSCAASRPTTAPGCRWPAARSPKTGSSARRWSIAWPPKPLPRRKLSDEVVRGLRHREPCTVGFPLRLVPLEGHCQSTGGPAARVNTFGIGGARWIFSLQGSPCLCTSRCHASSKRGGPHFQASALGELRSSG
jgi:hypothetical protein